MSRPWLAPAALVVATLSLLVNLGFVWALRHPARWIAPLVEQASGAQVDADGVLRYQVVIPAGTPLSLDIPVNERFAVRIDTVLPLNTRVRVPITGPLGTFNMNVPIRADVPLHTTVPLNIRHTFQLRTRTSQPISVPVQLRLR